MSNVLVEETSLQDIANAIREKTNSSDLYKPHEMADAIMNISGDEVEPEPATIGVNLHDSETDTPDTYLSGATVIAYNGWTTTDFIPAEDGKFYLAYSTSEIAAQYCSRFDADKANASRLSGRINCTDKNRPIFITGHDGYFRFSGTTRQIADLEFYEVINFDWKV